MEIFRLVIDIVISLFTFTFILYLLIFLLNLKDNRKDLDIKRKIGKLSVIIPARNEESCISNSIKSLIKDNSRLIKKIYIVINNSQDKTYEICKAIWKENKAIIKIININEEHPSKVKAVLTALDYIKEDYFLLLDADITLKKDSIKKMYDYLLRSKEEIITGIVDPLPAKGLRYNLISWDRIFRQRFLQVAKSSFGMANFPGTIAIINKETYKKSVNHEILEDYYITLNLLRKNKEVKLVPEIVAYEKERESFKSLFFQRVRWTRGNINLIGEFNKTLKALSGVKGYILISYPLFWYFIYYYLTLLLIWGLLLKEGFMLLNYLMVGISIYIILISSKLRFKDLKTKDFFICFLFVIIFPIVISLALLFSITLGLLLNKNQIFLNRRYFKR